MSTTTQRLGLFKYDTVADSAVPFNIDDALNYNWDILDEKIRSGRNIGELVYSSLPLTDAGLHLLDGSLILGEGIYQEFVDYMAELYDKTAVIGYKSNVTKVGSLADNNSVLSGFSTSNYGNIGNFPGNTASYEIVIKFMTSNVSSTEIFLGHNTPGSSSAYYTPQLRISNAKLCTYGPTNAGITGTTTLLANTWYWAKVKWNGTQKELYLSTDGQTFTLEGTISVSTSLTGGTLLIGNGTGESSLVPFTQGTIDLKESYIDINEERWWTGAEAIKPIFCTEEQWQQSVITYGVCGKFVYDSVNNTVRLPKITGIIEGTTDVTALGDLVEQFVRLPNITGGFFNQGRSDTGAAVGAFYKQVTSGQYVANPGTGSNMTVQFDASRSSSIYSGNGTDTKIQPQAIKCFIYIVIATSSKTEIQTDIDEVVTDLNGKADTDLSNINASQSAKNEIISWGMPDYDNGISIVSATSSSSAFTAPCDGIVVYGARAYGVIFVNGKRFTTNQSDAGGSSNWNNTLILLNKNDTFYATDYGMDSSDFLNHFFPMKGAN